MSFVKPQSGIDGRLVWLLVDIAFGCCLIPYLVPGSGFLRPSLRLSSGIQTSSLPAPLPTSPVMCALLSKTAANIHFNSQVVAFDVCSCFRPQRALAAEISVSRKSPHESTCIPPSFVCRASGGDARECQWGRVLGDDDFPDPDDDHVHREPCCLPHTPISESTGFTVPRRTQLCLRICDL